MNWRRLWRVLHRDLGYFFVGATVVYAVSGLALNHLRDWNPDYVVEQWSTPVDVAALPATFGRKEGAAFLRSVGVEARYKSSIPAEDGRMKFFYEGGTAVLDRAAGTLQFEELQRRPVLHLFDRLHRNPGRWWTWFSDVFCGALLFLAVSGLFILPGRLGLRGRGGILALAGVLLPAALVYFNL